MRPKSTRVRRASLGNPKCGIRGGVHGRRARCAWGLKAKPGSQKIIAPRGHPEAAVADLGNYIVEDVTEVVSWSVFDNGHTDDDWRSCCSAIWASFFRNFGRRCRRRLPPQCACTLLDRMAGALVQFRSTRWPPSSRRMRDIDSLQIKLVGVALDMRENPEEEPAAFARCRQRACRAAIGAKKWSTMWLKRAVEWDAHIRCAHADPPCWPNLLVGWRDAGWLGERRARFTTRGSRGRTATRVAGLGSVATRWEEGIALATRLLA